MFLACADATQDKTIRDANKHWLTVGTQTGAILLQNLPTHYPEWKPAKRVVEQAKHGRSPNLGRHGAGPRGLSYTPRLRDRKHRRPLGNN